ncbi:tRNA (adenosine(37)-N6)-dimethylallyltransferase MiaA [Homoserinibacter sp. YIM 151385]|uniref:tRNA (adenosine(37)-N6)-dimethylallyltransferase MiaA n=1 Tax=Homoserinibacter sp. YIM 151385 TaxID=2985506 RepID=UPI0022F0FDF0|nr:tRNA (adenosine(37)-N6)-dimethylallyltransferase MiaA [Homoserinibacter sp. YIM 151385]WBU38894.1 tRNA (adenosine(37)-N6)-dimethylallyltransferase MiaA [Homoserinibacter sp. YIM 151385]
MTARGEALPLIAIVGATGTGKSELSLDLAEALASRGHAAEIVNADAMQLYRGMDIGTAKLREPERRGIPHHLLDVLEPVEEASVARYQQVARATIEGILARGAVPIMVGGSGLYVSSVVYDFRFPGTDPEVRARLEAELEELGPGALHQRLRTIDAGSAEAIGPHNGRRLVRALEVVELTGTSVGGGLPSESALWRRTATIGLRLERAPLVERLDARVSRMWRSGLVGEVEALRPAGFGVTASRAIGYAQALLQLDGLLSEREAVERTAALTRRYARRQVGWFGRYRDTSWIAADDEARVGLATAAALALMP